MKKNIETIIKNAPSISIFSNSKLLLILFFLYRKEVEVAPKEISQFFKADIIEIEKHLSILEKNGLVEKNTKLDKSKKPSYLKSFYKINEKNYKKVLETVKNTVEICLQKTN